MLGHKEMITKVKNFYKARCQHAEWGRAACIGCGRAVDEWRNTQIVTVRHETRQALERRQHLTMVNILEEWHFRWVSDEELTPSTILVDDIESDTFLRPLQRITTNQTLTQHMNRLFGD